jgi:hypothetical protein
MPLNRHLTSARQAGFKDEKQTRGRGRGGSDPRRPDVDEWTFDPPRIQQDGGSLMKSPTIPIALACSLAASYVIAQGTGPTGQGTTKPTAPAAPGGAGGMTFGKVTPDLAVSNPSAPKDPNVIPAATVLPPPVAPDQLKPATIALPEHPIEPYLLTNKNGPFMVMAKTFRGPQAERFALALVLELRRDFHLPAYILRTKDFPKMSNIRNVPPTAPPFLDKPQLTVPEKVRTYDEAMVLIGDEKTLADQDALWKKVKLLHPRCLNEMPKLWLHREGLSRALKTANPYVPAQVLYPGRKKDKLIAQMNDGPHSVFHCPGRYSLQVAEFGGRTSFNAQDPKFFDNAFLKTSPLATAAADAEKLADVLAKDPEIQRTGYQPYVYHDLTTSRVMVGSFNDPRDPNALRLRQTLLTRWNDMMLKSKKSTLIAPANSLTDLEPIKETR